MSIRFRIYIVRHGETEWNRTRKIQGQSNVPLNEIGLNQSRLVGEALRDVPFVRAFSSDLQRAIQTAECILQHRCDVILEKDESIRERYYLGESQSEASGSDKRTPSAEPMHEFSARCLAWYTRSVESCMTAAVKGGVLAGQPQDILVVSHGGCVRTLLVALRANGRLICLEGVEIGYCLNTGVSILEYTNIPSEGGRPLVGTLVQYSGIEHLAHDVAPVEVNADVLGDEWFQP